MHFRLLSALALCSLVEAQVQTIVSPAIANGVEGSGANAYPWTGAIPKRYSQIHSDIGGTPKIITKIAGRMNGTNTSYAGTRVIDLELYIGDSVPWNRCSFVIPNNYIGTPTLVMPRQIVNMGPFNAGLPAGFDFAVPFNTPFVYVGVNSLIWEMLQYSNVANGTVPTTTDVESGSITSATVVLTGTGCIASGQNLAMTHVLAGSDSAGTFNMGFYVDHAPASAPTILYLGATNPNLAIPGLCGSLYTDLLVSIPLGLSDTTGFIGSLSVGTKIAGGPCSLMVPNPAPGAVLYTQVHSLDVGSALPIKVANSEGRAITLPTSNLSKTVMISRIYSNDTQTATNAHYFATSAIGYGAVMQFTY